MIDHPIVAWTCTIVVVAGLCLMMASPFIHQWERNNGYPFGYLCEVYRSCPK